MGQREYLEGLIRKKKQGKINCGPPPQIRYFPIIFGVPDIVDIFDKFDMGRFPRTILVTVATSRVPLHGFHFMGTTCVTCEDKSVATMVPVDISQVRNCSHKVGG